MPSELALTALEQLHYPCKHDTRALKRLEPKPRVRPQSAPPATRGNTAKRIVSTPTAPVQVIKCPWWSQGEDSLVKRTVFRAAWQANWTPPTEVGPVLFAGYVGPTYESISRLYGTERDPSVERATAHLQVRDGEHIAVFPTLFLGPPFIPVDDAPDDFDYATIATHEQDGGDAHDAVDPQVKNRDEPGETPQPETEDDEAVVEETLCARKARVRSLANARLAENRQRAETIKKNEGLVLLVKLLAKELLADMREELPKRRERMLTGLTMAALAPKHARFLKAARDATTLRRLRRDRKDATVPVTQLFMRGLGGDTSTQPSDRIVSILQRFIDKCRRHALRMKRRRAADIMRAYLRDQVAGQRNLFLARLKRAVIRVQRSIRAYLSCRQARVRALTYLWKDILRKKYNQAIAREQAAEKERFKKAMENETLQDVVLRLEFSRLGVKEALRRASKLEGASSTRTLSFAALSRPPERSDELTPPEMAVIREALVERRNYLMDKGDVLLKMRRKSKFASEYEARLLMTGTQADIRGLSFSICAGRSARRVNPLLMFSSFHGDAVKRLFEDRAERFVAEQLERVKELERQMLVARADKCRGGPGPVRVITPEEMRREKKAVNKQPKRRVSFEDDTADKAAASAPPVVHRRGGTNKRPASARASVTRLV